MATNFAPAELKKLIHPVTESYLRRFTTRDSLALEAGCGPGQYRYAVNGNFIGFDISAEDYRDGMPRHVDLIADARWMPFTNSAIDLVFFSNTFHYFDQANLIVQRAFQLLKTSGTFLIFDYSKKTLEGLNKAYQSSHLGFTATEHFAAAWVTLLTQAGFKRVIIDVSSPKWKRLFFNLLRILNPTRAYTWLDQQGAAIIVRGTKNP